VQRLNLITWNINSVRLRQRLVERLLLDEAPDVLCLQETKCPNEQFPAAAFRKLGYGHLALNGNSGGHRGYHGVAILSRVPLSDVTVRGFCGKTDGRYVRATVTLGGAPVAIHNFYVPAGGDEPDPALNPKFEHKLAFLDEMLSFLPRACEAPGIVVGDLNVAPYEMDVWSHRQMLRVISHTPEETTRFEAAREAAGYVDLGRRFVPHHERLFTWWSYRNKDWRKSDRGRRLDHVWAAPQLADRASSFRVLREARDWPRPSDHVPVVATFEA